MSEATAAVGPTPEKERIDALDVLRGVALFGVFLVNFTGFAGAEIMATEAQLAALPTAAADEVVHALGEWLLHDKANTVFGFLFGLGFWLQLERAQAKGADFEALYLRRLGVLLLIGVLHFVFVWQWDILHVYALAGFLLFFLRKLSDRAMLLGGLILALGARTLQEWLLAAKVLDPLAGRPDPYADAAVMGRQALSEAGDYPGLVRSFAEFNVADYYLNGLLAAWIFYALGRFMVGAWVGRKGWLQQASRHLDGFRRWAWIALPAGLATEGVAVGIRLAVDAGLAPEGSLWSVTGETIHLIGAPILAAGYVCAVVAALHGPVGGRLLGPFRWVGRMALTNYVMQSLAYALVLFGVGPGLALAGKIGSTQVLSVTVLCFALQVVFSRLWLSRFRYGPMEWVWRALTYGEWPRLRVATAQPAA